jgi:hypothetical protein
MAVKKQEKKNLGGAPVGNKNAYVDDEKEVIEKFTDMANGLQDGRYFSFSNALLKNGIGYKTLAYYESKYSKNEVVFQVIKKARELGELALEQNSLNGTISPAVAIFNLKHHYGHSDQPKQDNSKNIIVIERVKCED